MCIAITSTTTCLKNSSSNMNKRQRRSAVVTFSQDVIAKDVLHRSDYTQEEKESSFYTPRELSRMKHCTKLLGQKLDTMMTNIIENPNATRGLEHFMRASRRQIRASRQAVRNALFMEQKLQKHESSNDPEMIAIVCCDVTRSSQLKAIQIAQIDEQYVLGRNNTSDDHSDASDTKNTTTTAIIRRQMTTKTIASDDEQVVLTTRRTTTRVKSNSTIRLFASKAA